MIEIKNIKKFKLPLVFAVLSVFLMGLYKTLFGLENTVIGLIIAMASYAFLRLDLTSYPVYKTIIFIILNLFLSISAYLSSVNPYIGLIINFFILFTVSFIYTTEFRNVISYIFLLLYVYMLEYPTSLGRLPIRLASMGFGIFIIISIHILFNREKFKNNSNNLIIRAIENIQKEVCHIINDSYKEKENIYIDSELRKLLILIKGRNSNKFIENNKDNLYFDTVFILERINSILNDIFKLNKKTNDSIIFLKNLNLKLDNIMLLLRGEKEIAHKEKSVIKMPYVENINLKRDYTYFKECNILINLLEENIYYLCRLNKENTKKRLKLKFKLGDFLIDSNSLKARHLKVSYSLKIAVAVSLIMFIVDIFKIPRGRWIVTSVYVVIQPYREETLKKAVKRFKGTIIGGVIYIFISTFFKNVIPLKLLLLILMFLYFIQKDYDKKVICTAFMALSFSLPKEGESYLAFYRLLYVAIGILVALAVNKFIFPQSLKESIYDLKDRYFELTDKLLNEIKDILNKDKQSEDTFKILLDCNFIESKLMENKLISENKNLKDKLYRHSEILSKVRYLILFINYYNLGISLDDFKLDKKLLNASLDEIEKEFMENILIKEDRKIIS